MAKNNRFILSYEQGGLHDELRIIVDTQTGVNYIQVYYDQGTGLTPLLDAEGKVVVTPISQK